MEKSDLDIPVAYCRFCEDKVPVVLRKFDLAEFEQDPTLKDDLRELIYCPACSNILNLDRELKVEWYDVAELHKAIAYKVVGGDDESRK